MRESSSAGAFRFCREGVYCFTWKTPAGELESGGGGVGGELLRAEAGQDVTNQGCGEAMSELLAFFMGRSLAEAKPVVVRKVGFSLWS
jgi:hypothetical protein